MRRSVALGWAVLCLGGANLFAGSSAFKNVLLDVRDPRGGNGDVAAAYLTALDMIRDERVKGPVTLLVNPSSLESLRTLTGRKIEDGTRLMSDRIRIQSSGTLGASLSGPVDLYIQMAAKDEDFPFRGELGKTIPIDSETVLMSQTVIGNTEDVQGFVSGGRVTAGGRTFDAPNMGLAPGETGIYRDPIAEALRGKSRGEVRDFLLSTAGHVPDKDTRERLNALLWNRELRSSELVFAYGTSVSKVVPHQGVDYVQGLIEEAQRSRKPLVMVTPSDFDPVIEDLPEELKSKVVVLSRAEKFPARAEPGKVYVFRTGKLPQSVFNGLLAYSARPPLVGGDGALSAAIQLGKPFTMFGVPWNVANIDALEKRLQSYVKTPEARELISQAFLPGLPSPGLGPKLAANAEVAAAFERLRLEIPSVTSAIFSQASEVRSLVAAERAGSVHPETLRTDLTAFYETSLRASKGDPQALREIEHFVLKEPDELAKRILLNQMPDAALARPEIFEKVQAALPRRILTQMEYTVQPAAFEAKVLRNMAAIRAIEALPDKAVAADRIFALQGEFFRSEYEKEIKLVDLGEITQERYALDALYRIDPEYRTRWPKIEKLLSRSGKLLADEALEDLATGRITLREEDWPRLRSFLAGRIDLLNSPLFGRPIDRSPLWTPQGERLRETVLSIAHEALERDPARARKMTDLWPHAVNTPEGRERTLAGLKSRFAEAQRRRDPVYTRQVNALASDVLWRFGNLESTDDRTRQALVELQRFHKGSNAMRDAMSRALEVPVAAPCQADFANLAK